MITSRTRKPSEETIKTSEIRQSFLDYFARHDHRVVPSSPVIPFEDPTLLFTNAGMNQFKDVFTGQRKVPYSRATSSQKCIRAGGKHNDLDNVGFTARHHTFFEMLGNFSFGDYFKDEAIKYAWAWVTKDLGLDPARLYASVYETDDEAFELWGKIAPELKNGRILRFGKKDNYWSMGDVGPNGPCSEIHYDRGEKYGTGPEDVVNGETDRFVEIWNLVFMQYETTPTGETLSLPKPSVDTGAGLERIAAIMQDADSNYGIDLFQNIIRAISDLTGARYKDNVASHQVIADHLRALTFAITDGAGISNEGQGYVLRRILRRAARHGRLLGMQEPFIYRLVPTLVTEMGDAFPEIREKQSHVENVIKSEEESFGRTLETGLELFDKVAQKLKATGGTVVPGEDVFKLYDTYGFPFDLTEIIAGEQGLRLDKEGFDTAMEGQRAQSKAGANFSTSVRDTQKFVDRLVEADLLSQPATEFVRDQGLTANAHLLLSAAENTDVALVLDRTLFYVEAGGQISDTGTLCGTDWEVAVDSLSIYQDRYIHFGHLVRGTAANLTAGPVTVAVDAERRWDIMRNHTVTHLAHAALRTVLGPHIRQSGSYVGPDRMRFDFSHHQPMTPEEIREVERIVNEKILDGTAVETKIMDIDAARETGAMALFGEKYGDSVRVVSVGDFSMELCGGTHVQNIAQIGPFFITMETGIASGVRRLEAITGRAAIAFMLDAKEFRSEVASVTGRPEKDALDGVQKLRDANAELQKELKKVKADMFSGGGRSVGSEESIGDLTLITHDFAETDRDGMTGWIDSRKDQSGAVVAVAIGRVGGKTVYIASASTDAVKRLKIHVGTVSKEVLPTFGGRGGGKPNFAQGSVADGTEATDVFTAVRKRLAEIAKAE